MSGPVTHAYEGPLALFLIGLRIHQPWRLDVVAPAFLAMPRMLAELESNRAAAARGEEPDLGFLGARTLLDGPHPTVVQYWRSSEHIYRYAADTERAHRPAWKDFYRYSKRAPRAVTIWHETYAVPEGAHESFYRGPGRLGLALLDGAIPVEERGKRARDRMRAPGSTRIPDVSA